MHFVEYFYYTLLLRVYTNGAALLASPLSMQHNLPFASGSVSIVRNIFSVSIIVGEQSYIVLFDLNSCTIRLMRRTSAQSLQTAYEDHKSHLEPSTRLTHCITPTMKVHCLWKTLILCGTHGAHVHWLFLFVDFFHTSKMAKPLPSPIHFPSASCFLRLLLVQRARKWCKKRNAFDKLMSMFAAAKTDELTFFSLSPTFKWNCFVGSFVAIATVKHQTSSLG